MKKIIKKGNGRCPVCKFRIRGKRHESGMHHNIKKRVPYKKKPALTNEEK